MRWLLSLLTPQRHYCARCRVEVRSLALCAHGCAGMCLPCFEGHFCVAMQSEMARDIRAQFAPSVNPSR
jgi:hypothetical protein